MPQLHSGLIGGSKYQITNSVRLRASASAYFSRTFGAGGDRDKWWILIPFKRSTLGAAQYLFGADTASADAVYFNSSDKICVDIAGTNRLISTRVFRDPSAWGAFLVVFDASNGTNDLKLRVYYIDNGFAEITAWATNTRSGITAGTSKTTLNTAAAVIGKNPTAANSYFDGYLSHFHIGSWSGSQPTPASFGSNDSNGVWVFNGASTAYGSQGSWLDFKDANLTAGSNVGLGKDVSGNGNYWTTNNISVTAGVTYDSMADTPTNNYATLNPVGPLGTNCTLTNGGLDAAWTSTTARANTQSTLRVPTAGKWYWEVYLATSSNGNASFGVVQDGYAPSAGYVGDASTGYSLQPGQAGSGTMRKVNNNTGAAWGAAPSGFGISVTYGVAVDMDTGAIYFRDATGWMNASNSSDSQPTSAAYTGLSGSYAPAVGHYSGAAASTATSSNFGQRPFTYTPPTGFKALCTANQTITAPTASGTFTGNLNADGPFVWIGGVPSTLTINSNAVTFGTHADKTAGGFKLRTASASYNNTGSNTWSATFASPSTNSAFAHPQPAQGNP